MNHPTSIPDGEVLPARGVSRVDRPLMIALALLSAAVTAQQIAVMQVLGWMHWHHFAYMVVAIALLGFGISGTVLSLARVALLRHSDRLLPWLLFGAAITMPLGVRLAQSEALAVDLPLIFFAPQNAWRLAALCGLLLPPFFCGGLATALILTAKARQAGLYYSASLAGAGAGGLLGLALIARLAPPLLPVAAALPAWAAGAFLWPRLSRLARVGVLLTAGLLGAMGLGPGELTSSQFKPLQRTLDLPEARIIASRPGAHGWVQVVAAPAMRPSPAVSLAFGDVIPSQPAVFINGIPYGSLPPAGGSETAAWLDYTTDAAAFVVTKSETVLLLENGPGGWPVLAQRHGAADVIVVEPNRALVELLTEGEAPLAPEWRGPGVRVETIGGRAFLSRGDARFDVIRFPAVGAFGGSAGLGAASEQFLLTREAMQEAWQRLSPRGVIAVTAWMEFPERNPLRLLATLVEALDAEGASPRAHLVAVRGWATVTYLVGREAWDAAGIAALRTWADEMGFDPLVLPGLEVAERDAYHAWQNPAFFSMVDQLLDGPRENLYREYPFQLRPATDQRPYFSQFMRRAKTDELREAFGARAMPFFELGSLVVGLTFVLLAGLAVVCIVLPLVRLGWKAPGKAAVMLYYSGLGAGFMLIEIGVMLHAHAWLGSPVVAAAVVLTTLLFASGVGSLVSERFRAEPRIQQRVVVGIASASVVAGVLLAALASLARAWPVWGQVTALLLLVGSLGAAMGMAFPIGLRRLESVRPAHVPWAWAINGCVSVATPAGAMLLAMSAGFGALFVAGAAAYLVALAGAWLGRKE
jgi:hypothetical protein